VSEAALVLQDGTVYRGKAFGADCEAYGEVVFSTSMVGYQEMLTDPSFAGQIVVPTYPLIGNYGINDEDVESARIQVRGFVVRENCELPSHYRSKRSLHDYLLEAGIPGLSGVDTRAITRRLRSGGVSMGTIVRGDVQAARERLQGVTRYDDVDFVQEVSTRIPYVWDERSDEGATRIVVVDLGVKFTILRILTALGCVVTVVPCDYAAEDILLLRPQGVVFSPGPGNPALLDYSLTTMRALIGRVPIMGICQGHQILGRAFGADTFKLKFGHRGGNHPVKDLLTGRVHITSQNHGFAVDPDALSGGLDVSHVNLDDGTVEGLLHRDLPLLSIQYHSEASPGPLDNIYVFERFLSMAREEQKSALV